MTQAERRIFLIEYLKNEEYRLKNIDIPDDTKMQKQLLRALMNIRPARPISKKFTDIQDIYLREELSEKGITLFSDLSPVQSGIYLLKGDITRLSADAIVNAANSSMLGCFVPCHSCIDNAIHSAAGVQLRQECFRIMQHQKGLERTGSVKITNAYNLPCRYILHTVGPIIYGEVTKEDCEMLANCYRACLELSMTYHLKTVAFCCISTGEFHFPNEKAAKIAIKTVQDFQSKNPNSPEVIFNVFKDKDYEIYKQLLK
ncbi:protein-ADP-ribose hydrolase [Clostridiales bacterium]|nr:protein-ADP-ribose hydrolase [Clostridiales bacterium]